MKYTIALTLLITGIQPAWAERYSMIPTLWFSHENTSCQYYGENGTKTKSGTINFRIFKTCDAPQEDAGFFTSRRYISSIEWFEGRCIQNDVDWKSSLYFDSQFWSGYREKVETDPSKQADYRPLYFTYEGILKEVCQRNIDKSKAM